MSVHAGTILTVGANTVLQRVQDAGLGDVRIPIDTIREVGNELVVDQIPQEPDFKFSITSLDVSCDMEAFLHGKVGPGGSSGAASSDPDGTEYKWEDCQTVNLVSPWKDHATGSAGAVVAGHLIPGYYPTRVQYRFGVTSNAEQVWEIDGGSFYYGKFAPVEQRSTGDGAQVAFPTASAAIRHRKGGAAGSTFKAAFGVLVNGVPQIEGVDYTQAGGAAGPAGSTCTVTFTTAPANGASVRFGYFTAAAQAYPQSVHRSATTQPGAVRGRNICVSLASAVGASFVKIGSIQSFELEATVQSTVEREFCNEEIIGRSIDGINTTGQMVVRSRDYVAFFDMLKRFTGVDTDTEVIGYLNQHPVRLKCEVQKPTDPGTILKTLYVPDAIFTIPGTPAKVNTPTDFTIHYEGQTGTYSAFKGAMA